MYRFIILLAGIGRCASTAYYGVSGRAYQFIWSDKRKALIFEARDLSQEEFEKLAPEIFATHHDQNAASPVPMIISLEEGSEAPAPSMPSAAQKAEVERLCALIGAAEERAAKFEAELIELRGPSTEPEPESAQVEEEKHEEDKQPEPKPKSEKKLTAKQLAALEKKAALEKPPEPVKEPEPEPEPEQPVQGLPKLAEDHTGEFDPDAVQV